MNRSISIVLILLALTLGPGVAAAQTLYEDIVTEILGVDAADLVIAIEAPPTDDVLPNGFMAPVDGVPRNAPMVEAFGQGPPDLPGIVGTVIHGIDTDPAVTPGVMSTGILTYVVAASPLDEIVMDGLFNELSGRLDDPILADGLVEWTELDGVNVVLAHYTFVQGEAVLTVHMIVAPVGQVLLIATVATVDTEAVAIDDLLPLTGSLAIAGAIYLADVAAGL